MPLPPQYISGVSVTRVYAVRNTNTDSKSLFGQNGFYLWFHVFGEKIAKHVSLFVPPTALGPQTTYAATSQVGAVGRGGARWNGFRCTNLFHQQPCESLGLVLGSAGQGNTYSPSACCFPRPWFSLEGVPALFVTFQLPAGGPRKALEGTRKNDQLRGMGRGRKGHRAHFENAKIGFRECACVDWGGWVGGGEGGEWWSGAGLWWWW